jgi:hypothetical protein
MTMPCQTAGVSVFFDPITADLGISRTSASIAYEAATILAQSGARRSSSALPARRVRPAAFRRKRRLDGKLCCRPDRLLRALHCMWSWSASRQTTALVAGFDCEL